MKIIKEFDQIEKYHKFDNTIKMYCDNYHFPNIYNFSFDSNVNGQCAS